MFKYEILSKLLLSFSKRRFGNTLKLLIAMVLCSIISACSSKEKEEQLTDPNVLYQEAAEALKKDDYPTAATKFEQLGREHPASDLAGQAQINRAYAKYRDSKYDEAVMIADEFIKQYPAHHVTPYMYYLKGLCYYDQILDVGRDQELSNKTIHIFGDLIARFPNSKYARDAQLKIDYAYNMLAGKEMEIGRFYLNKGEIIAAVNRFKTVIDKYEKTIFIAEALYRMAEIYYNLGDIEQSKTYASVLGHNYPDSLWYDKAYNLFLQRNGAITSQYQKLTKDSNEQK